MMTHEEMMQLPIPEKHKDTPNIYRLARLLNSTGRPFQILSAMDALFTAKKEDGAA